MGDLNVKSVKNQRDQQQFMKFLLKDMQALERMLKEKWFEMALPQIEDCWKEIESGLHEENAHLKYKGKTRSRSNSNADESGSPKPTLPNAKLLEVMDLTNI